MFIDVGKVHDIDVSFISNDVSETKVYFGRTSRTYFLVLVDRHVGFPTTLNLNVIKVDSVINRCDRDVSLRLKDII